VSLAAKLILLDLAGSAKPNCRDDIYEAKEGALVAASEGAIKAYRQPEVNASYVSSLEGLVEILVACSCLAEGLATAADAGTAPERSSVRQAAAGR